MVLKILTLSLNSWSTISLESITTHSKGSLLTFSTLTSLVLRPATLLRNWIVSKCKTQQINLISSQVNSSIRLQLWINQVSWITILPMCKAYQISPHLPRRTSKVIMIKCSKEQYSTTNMNLCHTLEMAHLDMCIEAGTYWLLTWSQSKYARRIPTTRHWRNMKLTT